MKKRIESVEEKLSYREKMVISEVVLLQTGEACAVCPRCERLFDTEYQPFCSECGQALSWKGFSKVKVVPSEIFASRYL